MAYKTSPQVALLIAEAQLYAATIMMWHAHNAVTSGEMTKVEAGRVLAKQTRLEKKVHVLRYQGVPA